MYPKSRGLTAMPSNQRGQPGRTAPKTATIWRERRVQVPQFSWILTAIHLNVTEKSVASANRHNLASKILDLKFSSLSMVTWNLTLKHNSPVKQNKYHEGKMRYHIIDHYFTLLFQLEIRKTISPYCKTSLLFSDMQCDVYRK